MLIKLVGILTFNNSEQPLNALSPIFSKLDGRLTLLIPIEPENAPEPILFTPSGITKFTISSPFIMSLL